MCTARIGPAAANSTPYAHPHQPWRDQRDWDGERIGRRRAEVVILLQSGVILRRISRPRPAAAPAARSNARATGRKYQISLIRAAAVIDSDRHRPSELTEHHLVNLHVDDNRQAREHQGPALGQQPAHRHDPRPHATYAQAQPARNQENPGGTQRHFDHGNPKQMPPAIRC